MFVNNTAHHGGAIESYNNGQITFEGNSYTVFVNNTAAHHGGAINSYNNGQITFKWNSSTVFVNNTADDGGAIESYNNGQITFEGNSSTVFGNNTAAHNGGAIHSYNNGQITFEGNSSTVFVNNTAAYNGGAIESYNNGQITFEGNSSTVFDNNTAYHGGAIISNSKCQITFEGNSSTVFVNNTAAHHGGAINSYNNGQITFKWNSSTVFVNNTADDDGGAIESYNNGQITFEGNSSTVFGNNTAAHNGGAIHSYNNGQITFEGNSSTVFVNNTAAYNGGAIESYNNGQITFEGNSSTVFDNNTAYHGGAIISNSKCQITFEGNSSTVFVNNTAAHHGGAINSYNNGQITFKWNSSTVFVNNTADDDGGAIESYNNGQITFEGNSSTVFGNNTAAHNGGVIHSYNNGQITFEGNSSTVFVNNTAAYNGGAIVSYINGQITFEGNSSTVFVNNTADYGGALCTSQYGYNIFEGNSTAEFSNNIATYNGGAIYCLISNIYFGNISTTTFRNNIADYGGAISAEISSNINFSDNSTVAFTKNKATIGATTYLNGNSKIITKGNSTVKFDNILARWCSNTCLPYTDAVTIDSNGIVWCSNQETFVCLSINCYCKNLENLFSDVKKNTVIDIKDKVMKLSSVINLGQVDNISIIGHNNLTVLCVNGGRLFINCSNCHYIIEGITWIGCGGYSNIQTPVILLNGKYVKVSVQKCSFQDSLAPAIGNLVESLIERVYNPVNWSITIIQCSFINNHHYTGHGVAVYYSLDRIYNNFNLTIKNSSFSNNGPAKSIIYIKDSTQSTNYQLSINDNSYFVNNQAVPVYLSAHAKLNIKGEVAFDNNIAEYGAGIFIGDYSTVTFDQNSNAKFTNNSADHNGAAIFLNSHSNVIIQQGSVVKFYYNKATNGTIYSKVNSNVIFIGNCEVKFNSNSATQYGAAIYSLDNSHVTFKGNSKVMFNNNNIIIPFTNHDINQQLGGIIFSASHSYVSFEENSTTEFNNNIANFGAAILSSYYSNITFKDRSRVVFNSNIAQTCGTLTAALFSTISFSNNTNVTYYENTASNIFRRYDESYAGALCTFKSTDVVFSGNCTVTFNNNIADRGGAVAFFESNVIIEEYSTVRFNNNTALYSSGGAFECSNNSNIMITGKSIVIFNENKASQNGGAIYLYDMCHTIFMENSTLNFSNNNARNNGGVIFSSQHSEIAFKENTKASFKNNKADNGGIFYTTKSSIIFKDTSLVTFYNNEVLQSGGVGYFSLNSKIMLQGKAIVKFDNNRALDGGAVLVDYYSKFTVKENSTALFYSNLATVGGGAMKIINNSNVTLMDYTIINFTNNDAQYGAAMFMDITARIVNNCTNDTKCIYFTNNVAKILGHFMYQEVAASCNSSCLSNSILGISDELIATPPNELKFYDPAICIDDDNDTECNSYYVQNVMLGTELVIPTCVYNYYNYSVNSTQFLVQPEIYPNYFFNGSNEVLLSCNELKGISITGNQTVLKSTNFSIKFTLNTVLNPNWKQLSVNLTIELSPCHPGFWQYPTSKKCECYNANDIVFCPGSSSTIKRGYWFGNVSGKPTITFCPINYCNFTCCETTNGYYHLSPVRDNQCRSHRSGTVCGSCDENYTLSFDSVECVHVNECSIGWTIIIIILIVLYWIIIIVSVFTVMHFKVEIGYLYAITFYYSIVDILLNHNWYLSSALYTTINFMSSIAKIIPQFLGQFCFITSMSGIDQQFIHYIHPVAISLFLVLITVLARRSRKLSSFISKGIIHVICCLLLLSYTSLATTSLLLMRPLIFKEVDNVYTYLSPDVEYFHGRHLAYAIVAIICTLIIVIGLPLLLALEPFLNSKINFVKVKPLLDQFQGCYKDQYRYFAAYYMICRLVIIIIVISDPSNDFILQYFLISFCVIVALLHQILRPYSSSMLNVFDGIILHFLVLVSVLPLGGLFNESNSNLLVGITLILINLPLLIIITMTLIINKEKIKKLPGYCYSKCSQLHLRNYNKIPMNEIEGSTDEDEHVNVIDDSTRSRVNVTVCDV